MQFGLKMLAAGGLVIGTMAVTACETVPPAEAAGLCNRDAAETLAGRDRITDDEAKRITGSTIVRQIHPGQGVTMDYRQERVTVETDPATGKITRASCG